ncbi:GNAT family N-acetyltransferase [Bacillus sp. JJ1609]|uniref:GNAT family N-acetyltransferase n=1 Tax=Bacillus sp. JJ1609 TaxID=3122977 RepID=UPI002FFE8650
MVIRSLRKDEQPPWDLLLLADPSVEMVSSYLKGSFCYVAELDNSNVGIIVLFPKSKDIVEIMNIAVSEYMQGKGIGSKLIKHGIEAAKVDGFKTVEIGTGNSSISQLALYQKNGFRIIGIDQDFFLRNYPEPILENGIQCRDMIRLSIQI